MEKLCVGRAVLVEDDEVDVEQLESPVLVCPQQLSNDVEILRLVDPHQDDGEIARDAVGPQPRGSELVASQHRGRRSQRRIRVARSGWRGAGRGGPRRTRCRGDGAAPGPASTPGSSLARRWLARGTCPRDRGPPRVMQRRRSKRSRARWRRAARLTRSRKLKIGSSTAPTVLDSGRPSIDGDRRPNRVVAAEEAGPIRLELDEPPPISSSTAATCAAQIGCVEAGSWSTSRQQRADAGTNSVCTNRFWKAGWAMSAACGARAISAYDVNSICRCCAPRLVKVSLRISASCSADTTIVRFVTIEPSRRENSTWSSVR